MTQQEERERALEWVSRVDADNVKFAAASPGEKRVIIAKDVLQLMELGLVCGDGLGYGSFQITPLPRRIPVREALLEGPTVVCEACARAALMYASIMRHPEISDYKFDGQGFVAEFSYDILREIEAAYETHPSFLGNVLGILRLMPECECELTNRQILWVDTTTRPQRMVAIMQWIVDHEGEFSVVQFLRDKTEVRA